MVYFPSDLREEELKIHDDLPSKKAKYTHVTSQMSSPSGESVTKSVIIIQRAARKFLARQEDSLFKKGIALIDADKVWSQPLALSGLHAKVFLPQENGVPAGIVIKQCYTHKGNGIVTGEDRLKKSYQAKALCKAHQIEGVTIPAERMYRSLNIAKRIPFESGMVAQIGIYIENPKAFTKAIKGMTKFLCLSSVSDLLGGKSSYAGTFKEIPIPRFDNLVFYLQGEQSKIALLDLEYFEPNCDRRKENWCYCKCWTLVHLFPLHLNEIMEAAKQFDDKIEQYRTELEKTRDEVLKVFNRVYKDHLDFIKTNGITFENPDKPPTIKKEEWPKINKIESEVVKSILAWHDEHETFRGCLGRTEAEKESKLKDFAGIFPDIIRLIEDFLQKSLKKNFDKVEIKKITSSATILTLRTLKFRADVKEYKDLVEALEEKLCPKIISGDWDRFIVWELIRTILRELAKEKILIYNYAQTFGYYEGAMC